MGGGKRAEPEALADVPVPCAAPSSLCLSLHPMAQRPALTVKAHIVVRQDGRAIPLGRAPDDHVQQPVGSLNVMLLG